MKKDIYKKHQELNFIMEEIINLDKYLYFQGAKEVQNMKLIQYAESLQSLTELIANHE